MLPAAELFRRASIEMCGPVPWETPIPETASGVYVIGLVDPATNVHERLPPEVQSRWNGDEEIIYIGRAKKLRRRLAQFYRHVLGRPSPHRGGESIKMLTVPVQVYWGTTPDWVAAERAMIQEFSTKVGALPFGNRNRGTGRHRL